MTYKQISCIIGSLICFLLYNCTDVEDYYLEKDKQPQIVFSTNNNDSIKDSIKIGYERNYKYKVIDEEKLNPKKSSSELYSAAINNDILTIKATKQGNADFVLSVIDGFGKKGEGVINLELFDNLPPVAVLKYFYTMDSEGQVYLRLNGSESFDKDRLYGGAVTFYKFTVAGTIINMTEPIFNQILDPGIYTFSLQVKDNNGTWSLPMEYENIRLP